MFDYIQCHIFDVRDEKMTQKASLWFAFDVHIRMHLECHILPTVTTSCQFDKAHFFVVLCSRFLDSVQYGKNEKEEEEKQPVKIGEIKLRECIKNDSYLNCTVFVVVNTSSDATIWNELLTHI